MALNSRANHEMVSDPSAGTRRAISELLEFQTKTAWVIRDNVITPVPASEHCGACVTPG